LPESCFLNLREINSVIRELHIDYIHNTIQIGSGFVDSDYRGQRLSARIIDELIDRLRRSDPDVNEAYIQIFSCNIPSLRSSVNQGFKTVLEKESLNHEILKYLPSNKKFLVRKELCS
jgi:RimJ/RimL family protein N-acetyltransferase